MSICTFIHWVHLIDEDYFLTNISLILSFLRFRVKLHDGDFSAAYIQPTGWTHIVLNYIGPNDGQGIRIFLNGEEEVSDTTKNGVTYLAGDGRIVVGRWYTDLDGNYASFQVDELLYFNAALASDDVQSI